VFGSSAVSSFSLKSGDKKSAYGFKIYEPDKFVLRVTAEKSVRVTAPSHYTVLINGKQVDKKYIIESDLQAESCKHMPEGVSGITYCTYQVGELFLEPEIKVLTRGGQGKRACL
jgi:hypothetical protein